MAWAGRTLDSKLAAAFVKLQHCKLRWLSGIWLSCNYVTQNPFTLYPEPYMEFGVESSSSEMASP